MFVPVRVGLEARRNCVAQHAREGGSLGSPVLHRLQVAPAPGVPRNRFLETRGPQPGHDRFDGRLVAGFGILSRKDPGAGAGWGPDTAIVALWSDGFGPQWGGPAGGGQHHRSVTGVVRQL